MTCTKVTEFYPHLINMCMCTCGFSAYWSYTSYYDKLVEVRDKVHDII